MNIEELELSLRTEFEGQMRTVLAGVRQEVVEFQKKFEAEFEKQRTELDRTIAELSAKLPDASAFDAAFNQSVVEHLRLARDEGAQIAATAFGEAEKLKAETQAAAAEPASYESMRNAIAAISRKTSQATILQTLVEHASGFASRGAFFIVKNDHLVGWKTFGKDGGTEDGSIREVHFASSTDTLLSAAVRSMSVASGQYAGDGEFLDPIGFGRSENAVAIPLMARGRGVAVLYADAGNGSAPNVEALETLVRVAGLTVELLAASQVVPAPAPQAVQNESSYTQPEAAPEPVQEQPVEAVVQEETEAPAVSEPDYEVERFEEAAEAEEAVGIAEVEEAAEPEAVAEVEEIEEVQEYVGEVTFEQEPEAVYAVEEEPAQFETFQPVEEVSYEAEPEVEQTVEEAEPVTEYAFSSNDSFDATSAGEEPVVGESIPMVEAPASFNGNGHVATQVAEPVVEVATAQPRKSRLSERNMDLPIEVADDERRLHNDARRFARLLVSEIKLYNEQKVTEGRDASDLYQRLREAIDRSREMYDKRVQPAVASKFDYFHYELVNSLAEGQDAKLGAGYPGATV